MIIIMTLLIPCQSESCSGDSTLLIGDTSLSKIAAVIIILIAVFFFSYFIQLHHSRKIHYLSPEFHVKLHLKIDIALSIADLSKFKAEFPCQVMIFRVKDSLNTLK